MPYFTYGETEINHLKRKCKTLGAAIDRIGMVERPVWPDPFEALVYCIVSQQISSKAVKTVWNRFVSLLGSITPESILRTDPEAMQKCGMTMKKVTYIRGIAESAQSGIVNFETLALQTDEEIIKTLSSLTGVGVWTAEMILILSLCRPNVISYGDLAIRRGIMNLYGLKTLSKQQFEKYKKRYSPYNSVASLYLWVLSLDGALK